MYGVSSNTAFLPSTSFMLAMTEADHSVQEPQPFAPAERRTEDDVADIQTSPNETTRSSRYEKLVNFITWTPPRCRWDPESPPQFSMSLNLLFGFAGCFTVASLYYSHPILNVLARDFNVTYERASLIPTLAQAGYAVGLLLLCPLGDLFKRRPFVLFLVFLTATLWIGLCITTSFATFSALSFLTAVTTVTPQLMLPLVGELAPLHRKATALSIVTSGLLLGILLARVLAGIVTEYTSWRNIYWIACGLQYLILFLLWLFMPDYPSTNPSGLNYFQLLFLILEIVCSSPLLVQACIIGSLNCAVFTNFWTTLTFLLASDPYNYNSLQIGLFGFIGIGAMLFGPPYSRIVIDSYVPLFSAINGTLISLTGIIIGTYTGRFTVAGPVIQAFAIDFGMQTSQIANRSAIYAIAPKARNRVNTAFMVCVFLGQLMGTSVGNKLYAHSGWIASGSASVGFASFALLFCLIRGPWEEGWFGWNGGWSIQRRDLDNVSRSDEETVSSAGTDLEKDVNRGDHIRERYFTENLVVSESRQWS